MTKVNKYDIIKKAIPSILNRRIKMNKFVILVAKLFGGLRKKLNLRRRVHSRQVDGGGHVRGYKFYVPNKNTVTIYGSGLGLRPSAEDLERIKALHNI